MSSRRQKRTQKSQPNATTAITSAADIPYARPSDSNSLFNKPKPTKTLLEIAAERQAQLQPHTRNFQTGRGSDVVNVSIDTSGNIVRLPRGQAGTGSNSDASPGLFSTLTSTLPSIFPSANTAVDDANDTSIPPILDTLFLATSLSTLHCTLEVLVVQQYAQEILFKPIMLHTVFRAFPVLVLIIHFFHGHLLGSLFSPSPVSSTSKSSDSPPLSSASASSTTAPSTSPPPEPDFLARLRRALIILRSTTYLLIANVSGCYLIYLTNDREYYAVMKNAPAIGTLWVWSVLEMGVVGAVGGVVGPAGWGWWMGYSLF